MGYSKMEDGTTLGVLQRSGMMFVCESAIAVLTLPRVYYFFEVRENIMHELESRIFHPILYLACYTLADLTQRIPCLLIFIFMLLGIVPFHQDDNTTATFCIIVIVTGITVGFLADAISSLSRHHLSATSAYAGVIIFMLLFGASFISVNSGAAESEDGVHSDTVSFFMHFSIFLYAFQALMYNELSGQSYEFDINGVQTGGVSGEVWLKNLEIPDRMVENIFIVLGWGALFWIVAALGLLLARQPRRRSAVPSST